MLAQAPHIHLSMTSPSVYQRVKLQLQPTPDQTNGKLRTFKIGGNVLVRDFCPTSTAKWQQGTITAVCGELIYEVDCEGHQQQAHVDHLLPAALEFVPVPQDVTVLDTQCQMRKQAEPLLWRLLQQQKVTRRHPSCIIIQYCCQTIFLYQAQQAADLFVSITSQNA